MTAVARSPWEVSACVYEFYVAGSERGVRAVRCMCEKERQKETAESFTYDAEREGQGGDYRFPLASSVYNSNPFNVKIGTLI